MWGRQKINIFGKINRTIIGWRGRISATPIIHNSAILFQTVQCESPQTLIWRPVKKWRNFDLWPKERISWHRQKWVLCFVFDVVKHTCAQAANRASTTRTIYIIAFTPRVVWHFGHLCFTSLHSSRQQGIQAQGHNPTRHRIPAESHMSNPPSYLISEEPA